MAKTLRRPLAMLLAVLMVVGAFGTLTAFADGEGTCPECGAELAAPAEGMKWVSTYTQASLGDLKCEYDEHDCSDHYCTLTQHTDGHDSSCDTKCTHVCGDGTCSYVAASTVTKCVHTHIQGPGGCGPGGKDCRHSCSEASGCIKITSGTACDHVCSSSCTVYDCDLPHHNEDCFVDCADAHSHDLDVSADNTCFEYIEKNCVHTQVPITSTLTINVTYGNNSSVGSGTQIQIYYNGEYYTAKTGINGKVSFDLPINTDVTICGASYYWNNTIYASVARSLAVDEAEETYNLNLTRGTKWDHFDIRLNASYKITIGGRSYVVGAAVAQGKTITVVAPNGASYNVPSTSVSTTENEFRLTGQNLPKAWNNAADYANFRISCTLILDEGDLSKIPNYEELFEDLYVNGKYQLTVTDYSPTENVCVGGQGSNRDNASGYDFEIHPSIVTSIITKGRFQITKEVYEEDGSKRDVDNADTFTFDISKVPLDGSDPVWWKTVVIEGNDSYVLTDADIGLYLVVERQAGEYAVIDADGDWGYVEAEEEKEEGEIPEVVFKNKKLGEDDGLLILGKTSNVPGSYYFDIYAVDAEGEETAVETGIEVEAGKSKTIGLAAGDYIVYEQDASDPTGEYTLKTTIEVNSIAAENGAFAISAGSTTSVAYNNQYTEYTPDPEKPSVDKTVWNVRYTGSSAASEVYAAISGENNLGSWVENASFTGLSSGTGSVQVIFKVTVDKGDGVENDKGFTDVFVNNVGNNVGITFIGILTDSGIDTTSYDSAADAVDYADNSVELIYLGTVSVSTSRQTYTNTASIDFDNDSGISDNERGTATVTVQRSDVSGSNTNPSTDPTTDIGDTDPPLSGGTPGGSTDADITDTDPPLSEAPGDVSEVDVVDEDVPLDEIPQTGDSSMMIFLIVAMLASACGMFILTRKTRKSEN